MDELLMHNQNTLSPSLKKYWRQRYSLFSKFDEGIYMSSELWYSVTPENLAIFVAKCIKYYCPHVKHVLDVFCGGGGNTIQFARFFERTGAVDINPTNVYCTRHNCSIYGVEDKIWTIVENWCTLAEDESFLQKCREEKVDCVFSSPPWGGPAYKHQNVFDLDNILPLPFEQLLRTFFKISKNVVSFLPRNIDLNQLNQITKNVLGEEGMCRAVYVDVHGWRKGVVVFWGEDFTNLDYDYYDENGVSKYNDEYESQEKDDAYQTSDTSSFDNEDSVSENTDDLSEQIELNY